jgi:ribonuclease P protein component
LLGGKLILQPFQTTLPKGRAHGEYQPRFQLGLTRKMAISLYFRPEVIHTPAGRITVDICPIGRVSFAVFLTGFSRLMEPNESCHETNIPTQQPEAQADPRLPCPDGHQGWSSSTQGAPRQGPGKTDSLTDTERDGPFPRANRLTSGAEFRYVFEGASRVNAGLLTLLARPNCLGYPRLGLAVPKKHLRSAAARNRVKRQVRESFRRHKGELDSLDVVVLARHGIGLAEPVELRAGLDRGWGRLAQRCKNSSSS